MIIKEDCCCAKEIQKIRKLTYLLEKTTFKSKGLTASQATTITELLGTNGLSMGELSKRVGIDTSTLSRNIQKLIDSNLVEKKYSEIDKRSFIISLTEEGREKATEIEDISTKKIQSILCKASEEEFEKMVQGVNILVEILNRVEEN